MKGLIATIYVLIISSVVALAYALFKSKKNVAVIVANDEAAKDIQGNVTKPASASSSKPGPSATPIQTKQGAVTIPPKPGTPCAAGWELRWTAAGKPYYYCAHGFGDVKK